MINVYVYTPLLLLITTRMIESLSLSPKVIEVKN